MSSNNPSLMETPLVLTVEKCRQVDTLATGEFEMNSLVLMENAGRGCADILDSFLKESEETTILCGPGNNGGDGLVIARHLHAMKHPLSIWMFASPEKFSKDAKANWKILEHTKIRVGWIVDGMSPDALKEAWKELQFDLTKSAVIVDALLGTGATGPPRSLMAECIRLANACNACRIAIDIPTGLDASSGVPCEPTFHARSTLTFVALKPGFQIPTAAPYLGDVHILPIGIPPEVLDRLL